MKLIKGAALKSLGVYIGKGSKCNELRGLRMETKPQALVAIAGMVN